MAFLTRKSDKVELLRQVELFSALSTRQLEAVARATTEVPFTAGELLAAQGTDGDCCYVVAAGSLNVRRNGRKIAALGPGQVAGEMAVIDGEPRTADLIAAEDGAALVMTRREFGGLLDQVPGLQRKVLVALSQRLRKADSRLYG